MSKDFKEGLAPVKTEDEKWGFIDAKGRLVIKPQFEDAESFYNGLAKVEIRKEDWIYEGYINHKAEYVVKPIKKKQLEEEF